MCNRTPLKWHCYYKTTHINWEFEWPCFVECKGLQNLMSLPSTFFNMTWLKDLNLCGCSKLLENLRSDESVEVNGQKAFFNAIFETTEKIVFGGFQLLPFYPMLRSSKSMTMGLLSSSLFGLAL